MNRTSILEEARSDARLFAQKIDNYLGSDYVHTNKFKSLDSHAMTATAAGLIVGLSSIAVAPALLVPAVGVAFAGASMVVFSALYKAVRGDKITNEQVYASQLDNKYKVLNHDNTTSEISVRDLVKQMDDNTFYKNYKAVEVSNRHYDRVNKVPSHLKVDTRWYQPKSMEQLLGFEGHGNPSEAVFSYTKAIALEEKSMIKTITSGIASLRDKFFSQENELSHKNKI